MAFKKGTSGNLKGRPPTLLPEVQRAIDANKNALKVLILDRLDGRVHEWIDAIILQGTHEGDAGKLKILLEIALGKLVTEPPEFELSDEEKILILEYRRRKKEQSESNSKGIDELPR